MNRTQAAEETHVSMVDAMPPPSHAPDACSVASSKHDGDVCHGGGFSTAATDECDKGGKLRGGTFLGPGRALRRSRSQALP